MSLDYLQFNLPEFYPFVLFAAGMIAFQITMNGAGAAKVRQRLFADNEAMKARAAEEHEKNFKTHLTRHTYPEYGEGPYGDLLSYKDWYTFSLNQLDNKN